MTGRDCRRDVVEIVDFSDLSWSCEIPLDT